MYRLHTPFPPAGDQKKAIAELSASRPGRSTLLGVTGSGKTYTMANVIAQQNKPVLILSPNKTLAAQLYEEFSQFFPDNKVCYFVSYYDYYQPESYLPSQDMYIPKETKVNSEIERLRVESTASLINRKDTIIISSVSCIYSLGNPQDYRNLAVNVSRGQKISRSDLLRELLFIQYERNDIDRRSGTLQVQGSCIDVMLPYQPEVVRIEFFGSEIERIVLLDQKNYTTKEEVEQLAIFPAKHFVTTEDKKRAAIESIQTELDLWLPQIANPVYKERLRSRVEHDLELLEEHGTCPGIENYSVHFDGRKSSEAPFCLFDFFDDCLTIIDESHIAIPQLNGMYAGNRARKQSLVDFGFRLPSALDNRPLQFEEIEKYLDDVVFVSATPGAYELKTSDTVVEQIIRPTGLVDPEIHMHKRESQLDHLVQQIQRTTAKGYRTLVTVLTKKLAEELAEYLEARQIKACYVHHALKTPQRTEILHKLRTGVFDCLVGVNLLREGLDLPEVACVAIMDADIEGFLRDKRSLVQTIGRAARNAESVVWLYADTITKSMKAAIDETERRRQIQISYNEKQGITPQTVRRSVTKSISSIQKAIAEASKQSKKSKKDGMTKEKAVTKAYVQELEKQMHDAAAAYDFERAIYLREEWKRAKAAAHTGLN